MFKPSGSVVTFPTPESIPAKRPRGRPRKDGEPPHQSPEVELAEAVALMNKDEEPAKAQVTGRTTNGVNWAGVFLLYSKGVSLEELADQFGLPRAKLLNKARAEEWDLLVKHHGSAAIVAPPPMASVVTQSAAEVDKAKARIEANREEAFTVAKRLRSNIVGVLGTYEKESAFMRPEDILTLAKAAKMIDDAAMVALGDAPVSAAQAGRAGAPGSGNALPQIVINIPNFVSPQALREAEKQVSEIPQPEAVKVRQLQELELVEAKPLGAVEASATAGKKFTIDFTKLGAAVDEEGDE